MFEIGTDDNPLSVGFKNAITFDSTSVSIVADSETATLSFEVPASGITQQFFSGGNVVRLQSGVFGERANLTLVGSSYHETLSNTGGPISPIRVLMSQKVLTKGKITEIHCYFMLQAQQGESPTVIYAQMFRCVGHTQKDFEPIEETLIEVGHVPYAEQAGRLFYNHLEDLSIEVQPGDQLLVGFYNVTEGVDLTTSTTGNLSVAIRINDTL